MTIYYGVVHGKTIVLPDDVDVAEGTHVEVHILKQSHAESSEMLSLEERFLRKMIVRGIVDPHEPIDPLPPDFDDTPIRAQDTPLSETILEERR